MSRGVDRLKTALGANIADSIRRDRGGQPGAAPAADAPPQNRYAGLDRVKAFAIPLDRIVPDPDQPRKEFDPESLGRLARSLRERGQLQPCRVRWDASAALWVVVAGERRLRAAKLAGLDTLQCVDAARDLSPEDRLAEQLVENCLRDDLSPVEQANAYRALMEQGGMSQRQIAEHLHVSQGSVSRALALLGLPGEVRDRIDSGSLSAAAGAELARIAEPAVQVEAARVAAEEGLNRGEVAELVQALKAKRPAPPSRPEPVTVEVDGCQVTMRWRKPNGLSPLQVLRRACRQLQDRDGEAA
jgi:ParB family transcriptional regulator, chromosome partitioning protein